MLLPTISLPDQQIKALLLDKINNKTKPLGALGQLEKLALQIGLVQQTLEPQLKHPHMVVFAASHGIASEGVSAYPQEVTYQMVLNFLGGGAAVNVFTKQHGIQLTLVDAGVDHDFEPHPQLIQAKINYGTRSFLNETAMSEAECMACMAKGKEIVQAIKQQNCNVIGFGEMGIGNTSSAAVLMSKLLNIPLALCTGRGTGLDDMQFQKKNRVLQQALDFHQNVANHPLKVLQAFGGFEIAMMAGAMLEAASAGMLVLVDGFISSVAFLCAYKMDANIMPYAVFCHQSDEQGHALLLQELKATPLLRLSMRLGEGTGCAVAYPLLQSAVTFLYEMASFESAGVSNKS
ncbi:nicotinate-nucleotide--dimethylbenzimidazole phosphoribosyltransferase [Pontibacter silvestris]|uniref:Nicotinate-nucleotide--dimethylbenzimidazole phosphoribosyltransferase n=1 Tax=Pontibacter silvestris TaxID=2305183 RepID=A0ABW4X0E2_9BACT|nr:nicotinate-nucleotide--dimethylbenzimidazole phosphoribosyltransferase [Pontibacter silvestris]MCC9138207.1 nicotinate-nucleotide--dimethylbenzimidazole phosphoribosyltransferase [Pontibacter silvestris]